MKAKARTPLPADYFIRLKPKGHWGVWHVNGNEILSSSSRESTHATARNYSKATGLKIRRKAPK